MVYHFFQVNLKCWYCSFRRILHPTEDRPLTPRERATVQSFPRNFELVDTGFVRDRSVQIYDRNFERKNKNPKKPHVILNTTRRYEVYNEMVGNAVPPRIAEMFGQGFVASLKKRSDCPPCEYLAKPERL